MRNITYYSIVFILTLLPVLREFFARFERVFLRVFNFCAFSTFARVERDFLVTHSLALLA